MVLNDGEQKRRLGREIRRQREKARLSQYTVSEKLSCAQTTVSSWERGTRLPRLNDLERLDRLLNTQGALVRLLQVMEEDSLGYASWARDAVAAESDASEIREYQPLVVPGLLQTSDYARAQVQMGRPSASVSAIDETVNGRLKRQELLTGDGPLVSIIVEEHVLRRPLGGRTVLSGQLQHLLQLDSPRLRLQAIPMDSDVHLGTDGAFNLLTIPGRGHLVYRETRVDSSVRDDSDTIDDYISLFSSLSAYALTPRQTHDLIRKIDEQL